MKQFIMKLMIFFVIINLSHCISIPDPEPYLKRVNPSLFNQIIGTWYILSLENFGKVNKKISFLENGLVEIENLNQTKTTYETYEDVIPICRVEDNYRWFYDNTENKIIIGKDIPYIEIKLLNDYNEFIKPYNTEFNVFNKSIYHEFCSNINVCNIIPKGSYSVSGESIKMVSLFPKTDWSHESDKLIAFYVKNLNDIEIIKNQYNINTTKIDKYINMIIDGFTENDIFNLYTNYDQFLLAYFNSRENRDIANKVVYKGDEFQFEKDKIKFSLIRQKKYLIMYCEELCILPEYDFKHKMVSFTDEIFRKQLEDNSRIRLFELVESIDFKINPKEAEILFHDIRNNTIDYDNEDQVRDMLRNLNENLYLNKSNNKQKFYFSKPFKMIVLFEIGKTHVDNAIFANVKNIDIKPLRSMIIFNNGKILKNF